MAGPGRAGNQPFNGPGEATGTGNQQVERSGNGDNAEVQQRHGTGQRPGTRGGHDHDFGVSQHQGMTEQTGAVVGNGPHASIQGEPQGRGLTNMTDQERWISNRTRFYLSQMHNQSTHHRLAENRQVQETVPDAAQSDRGASQQQQNESGPPAPVEHNNPRRYPGLPNSAYPFGQAFQPAFSWVRSDGVHFPMPFPPGHLTNPLYLPPLPPYYSSGPCEPNNPPANMIDPHFRPFYPVTIPMDPSPSISPRPAGTGPDPPLGSLVQDPTSPRPVQGGSGQSIPVPQTPNRSLRPLSRRQPLPHAHGGFGQFRVRPQTLGQPVDSSLQFSTPPGPVRGGQGQRLLPISQNPTQSADQSPQGGVSAEPVQGTQRQSNAATPTPDQSCGPSSPQSRVLGSVSRDVSQSHPNSVSSRSQDPRLSHESAGIGEGQEGATAPSRGRGRGPVLGYFSPRPQNRMPHRPAPITPVPTPHQPHLAPSSNLTTTVFENITAHTAKCDVCNKRNSAGLTRCTSCGWQSCHGCTIANGCLRRHLNHISPTRPDELIPLPPKPKKADKKRKAAESPGREHPNTGKKAAHASEGQSTPSEMTEGRLTVPESRTSESVLGRGRGRGRGKDRGRGSTKRGQASTKIAAPKPSAARATKSSSVSKPVGKEDRGKGRAEEAQTRGASQPPGSPGNDTPTDTESATSSVIEGARALCTLSADAFRRDGQEVSQRTEEDAPRQTFTAPRHTSTSSRPRGGSSQRVTSSVQPSSPVHEQQKHVEEDDDDLYDDDQRDKDYVDEELDAVDSESEESIVLFPVRPRPQMLAVRRTQKFKETG